MEDEENMSDSESYNEASTSHGITKQKLYLEKPGNSKQGFKVQQTSQSAIWSFFNKSKNGQEGTCKACTKTFKTPNSTTSTLIRHLKSHDNEYEKFVQEKKGKQEKKSDKTQTNKITNYGTGGKTVKLSSSRTREITRKVACMIAKDFQPLSIVQDKGFSSLMEYLEPSYKLPSRLTFAKTIIPTLFEEKKGDIKKVLSEDFEKMESLSLTTDLWTSRAKNSYIGITVHYLTNEFVLKNFSLSCAPFPETHDAFNIKQKIQMFLNEWELDRQKQNGKEVPIYVVTDNGKNIKNAIRDSPSWSSVLCMAHTLQLAVHDAKGGIGYDSLIAKCKKIVSHYNHSPKSYERLKKLQSNMNLPCHRLIQMVSTRWNSEFYMLQRLVEQQQVLSADIAVQGKIDNLSTTEWALAAALVEALEPVEIATRVLSSARDPTLSQALPILFNLKAQMNEFLGSTTSGKTFAKNFIKSLDSRFAYMKDTDVPHHLLAMMLDPRFKDVLLEEQEVVGSKNILLTKLKERWPYSGPLTVDKFVTKEKDEQFSQKNDSKLWGPWDKKRKKMSNSSKNVGLTDHNRALQQEMNFYFDQDLEDRKIDILVWWKEHSNTFQYLTPLAQQYLGIPATEVESERLFSTAGNVVTRRREALLSKHVEMLVFLNKNV